MKNKKELNRKKLYSTLRPQGIPKIKSVRNKSKLRLKRLY
jgi:DNA-binding phage protein